MTNDTVITIQGWLAGDPSTREVGGATVANFRVGSTPRRFVRSRNEWVDGETQWYGVSAWRALGEHCNRSLHKGDPVVLYGRLTHRTYRNNSGADVIALEIEAYSVGHDLSRGLSNFIKVPRAVQSAASSFEQPAPEDRQPEPWRVPSAPGFNDYGPAEDDPRDDSVELAASSGSDGGAGGAGNLVGESATSAA